MEEIKPKVVILSLNYNQPEMTLECVNSILKLRYDNFSLYIIDNFSSEENFHELKDNLPKDSRVDLIRTSRNLGYGKGINFGLEYTKDLEPDYWLIMNNDTIIEKNALAELVKVAEKYARNSIVSGKIYHYNDPDRLQYIGGRFKDNDMMQNTNLYKNEIDVGQAEDEMEMDMLDDIFWLLPIKIFNKIGGYCPYYFMYAEQSDYALEATCNGYKLIYTPKAKLWHKGELSSGMKKGNPITNYWRSKSSMIYLYRNLGKRKFRIKFFVIFVKLPVKVILFFLTSDSFINNFAKYLGFLSFIKWMFSKNIDYGYNPFIRNKK